MGSTSPDDDAIRQLLTEAGALGGDAAEPVATSNGSVDELANTLDRWFGPYGTHALLTRALAQARRDHPALETVRLGAPHAPRLDGVADATRVHGAAVVADGVAALMSATVALLGRMIGEDLALHLVERRMERLAPAVLPRVLEPPPAAGPPTTAVAPDAPSDGGGA